MRALGAMSNIQLEQIWEDGDGMLRIELLASNGKQQTSQDFYTYPSELRKFAKDLENYFPKLGKGEVEFEYGSETENFYSYVLLRFFYVRLGIIGIHIKTNSKEDDLDFALSEFYIQTELHKVNELGRSLSSWCNNTDQVLSFIL